MFPMRKKKRFSLLSFTIVSLLSYLKWKKDETHEETENKLQTDFHLSIQFTFYSSFSSLMIVMTIVAAIICDIHFNYIVFYRYETVNSRRMLWNEKPHLLMHIFRHNRNKRFTKFSLPSLHFASKCIHWILVSFSSSRQRWPKRRNSVNFLEVQICWLALEMK